MIAVFSSFWHWLFEAECKSSADLLALSFAINAILTGLSIAKYNLCPHIKQFAVWCISKSTDDKFLARLESLGKDHKVLVKFARAFSTAAEWCRKLILAESKALEMIKRALTSMSALAAFIILAFDPTSRIGVALVLPYVLFVILHFIFALIVVLAVFILSLFLSLAMKIAGREKKEDPGIGDSIAQLKKTRAALTKPPAS